MNVVNYLVNQRDRAIVPLKSELKLRKISYYHLCLLTLKIGEWGGEEILQAVRFIFNVKISVITPQAIITIGHDDPVHMADLVLG